MTRPLLIALSAFAFGCAGKASTEPSDTTGGAASNNRGATSGAPGAGNGGSAAECKDVACPSFACPDTDRFVTLPGDCCPSCIPPTDAGTEPPLCPSVAAYCDAIAQKPPRYSSTPQAADCVRDWTMAEEASSWCPSDAGTPPYTVYVYPACNGYDRVVLGGTDTNTTYLYDSATGQLVGIGGASLAGWSCIAGTIPASDVSGGCVNDAGQPPAPLCGE